MGRLLEEVVVSAALDKLLARRFLHKILSIR